jgi:hypothetical protein
MTTPVMIAVIALMNIDFDGVRHEAGQRFELPQTQANELLELRAARLAPSDADEAAASVEAASAAAAHTDLKAALEIIERLQSEVTSLTAARDAAVVALEALQAAAGADVDAAAEDASNTAAKSGKKR